MEVSAKSNINVEKAFFSLAGDIKKRLVDTQGARDSTGTAAGGGNVDVGAGAGGLGGAAKNCCSS